MSTDQHVTEHAGNPRAQQDAVLFDRLDRARAEECRWGLEVAMIGEFGLTLPPETEPLDHERRHDHLRWRTKALVRTRRIRARRERRRAIRRFLTLGLWWD